MLCSMPSHMWGYELDEHEAILKDIPLVSALELGILVSIGI